MDPIQGAKRIAHELMAAGIPYAIGGALAYGYWGTVRATQDLDVNIFCSGRAVPAALDALERAGAQVNRRLVLDSVANRGDARVWLQDLPVDVFFNSIPLHESASGTAS